MDERIRRAHWGILASLKKNIEKGGDINYKDDSGRSALHHAATYCGVSSKHAKVLLWLLKQRNIYADIRDDKGSTALHYVAECKDINLAKALINAGCNVNDKNFEGKTPAYCAVFSEQKGMLKFLHERGADLQWNAENNDSLVHVCAQFNKPECLKYLCRNGADVNCTNESGLTPLMVASAKGQVAVIRELIKLGCDLELCDNRGISALSMTAYSNDIPTMRVLLKAGALVDGHDESTMTPLMLSAIYGNAESMEELVDSKADIGITDSDDLTLLHLSAIGGSAACINYLLSKNSISTEVRSSQGHTPILYASRLGKVEAMKELKKHGADIHARDMKGSTVLHLAAQEGHVECLEYGLTEGLGIDDLDKSNQTPLVCAVKAGKTDAAKFLVSNGANIYIKQADGATLLHVSSRNNNTECLSYIADILKNIDIVAQDGKSALTGAAIDERIGILDVLLSKGANLKHRDDKGFTALHAVSFIGKLKSVKWLLDHDEGLLEMKDTKGLTAMAMAVMGKQSEVIDELTRRGSKPIDYNRCIKLLTSKKPESST